MKIIRAITIAFCMTGLLVGPAIGAEAAAGQPEAKPAELGSPTASVKASFQVTDRYTAQRRPRVTVLAFENTNSDAQYTGYGSSVEAMLVTFLKRKSQFVVVERQKLDRVLVEKQRLQKGMVQIAADDKEAQALLEKIDIFVLGSVTLLDIPTTQNLPPKAAGGTGVASVREEGVALGLTETDRQRLERREAIQGPRIEIDVKLISRFDGRIIAAAQRSGPVACLRSIVERLGIALEQEFLRPYYGRLRITLDEPEHIRAFLTPILPEDALDEEKPPVEYSTTVTIGSDHDEVETWTTDPSTYTIKSVLSGWYSMRIERPGYNPIGADNARWEVRRRAGREVVYDHRANLPLDKVSPEDSRFIVRVDPLNTDEVNGNALGFKFVKQGGSIAPVVKRQYLDADYSQAPSRVILMGGPEIELNQLQRPAEYADDERCDLFQEVPPNLRNYGRTHVADGGSFDFDSFTAGELIIEDYRGEKVPVGFYEMVLWESSYNIERHRIRVRPGDDKNPVKIPLNRETAGLSLAATGPHPPHQVFLQGSETRQEFHYRLDFEEPKNLQGLPADDYVTTTNVTGLDGWQATAAVPASNSVPPAFDAASPRDKLDIVKNPQPVPKRTRRASVKTRFGLAGRLETLSRSPDLQAADLFVDDEVPVLLNLLLYRSLEQPEEDPVEVLEAATEAAKDLVTQERARSARWLRLPPRSLLEALPPPPGDSGAVEPPQPAGPPEPMADGSEAKDPVLRRLLEFPDLLRQRLAERLELVDLLVLDQLDMVYLQLNPDVAAIVARYVASGGSVFAYIAAPGDYRQVLGAPFGIEKLSKPSRRLDLAPGDVDGLIPQFKRKDVKVKGRRRLPEVRDLSTSWRILAYTRKGRRPRIVDREGGQSGGYVALWLDDPKKFRSRSGGIRPKVEETRAAVEDHVLKRARANMHRRFDRSLRTQQPCTAPAATLP